MSSIQPGGNFMRRMPVGGTANLAKPTTAERTRCKRAEINPAVDGELTVTPCPNFTVNDTLWCLEHAEPGTGSSAYTGAYLRTDGYPAPLRDEAPTESIPARPYSLPVLEPAPPTQRGWLDRALGRIFQ